MNYLRLLLMALIVATSTNQAASQTTRPAFGGGWADWITVPGWFESPQQFCDASVASLQHYFGKRTYFYRPDHGRYYYVPDSATARVRVIIPNIEAVDCLPQCAGGCPIDAFVGFGWFSVWVCPKNTVGYVYTGNPTLSTVGYGAPTFLDTYFDRQPYVSTLERQIFISPGRVDCQVSGLPVGSARAKNVGRPSGVCLKGNPINHGIGNKLEHAVDYAGSQELRFSRTYNSDTQNLGLLFSNTAFGTQEPGSRVWRSTFDRRMTAGSASQTLAVAVRADGRAFEFIRSGSGQWTPDLDIRDGLIELISGSTRTGWKHYDEVTQEWETYDANGVLLSIVSKEGNLQRLSYADGIGGITPMGAPTCVLPGGISPPSSPTPARRLQCVTDSFGRQLNFHYDAEGRLSKLIDPAGGVILYAYDESSSVVLSGRPLGKNLTSVTYPNGLKRSYHYNEQVYTGNTNLANALTGISDEMAAGQIVRYGIYKYDGQGRAISTEHGGGVYRYSVNYVLPYQQSVVTDPLGTQRTYNFSTILGVVRQSSVNQPAGAGSSACSDNITYDSQANVASRTDFNNNKICYAYDLSRNLETKRVEGLTSSAVCSTALSTPPIGARLISTQWHPDWRLETRIAEPKKLTTITYNGQGATCAPSAVLVDGKPPAVVCTRTEQATTDETGAAGFAATVTGTARTWRYTYTTYGRMLTATDSNNRVTTTSYHPDNDADLGKRGNVASITNAANHTTFITDYNPHGQPTRIVDPNGVVTVLTYDPRLRLTSRTVGNEATVFGYDPVGQMTSVTLPDGARLTYTYDAAHRLTEINDHKGNAIEYTLDAMGNRRVEQMKDPAGVLVGNIARVIDALNRVQQVTGVGQ